MCPQERIWAWPVGPDDEAFGQWGAEFTAYSGVEYIRADLVATARAEARREALEEAAKVAAGWETTAADDAYMTCGNGHFWDPGTNYDQARADAGAAIRALMEKGQSDGKA
ncbi:hypothetical protein QOZ94_002811 [Xanthobacter agilis]|uniref:Uncharacterized protein n=1 Tax=Xanthobacter agilis TaxID=47492 RepID=A0ABU0LFT3_XANAG|nr:hypothetical protein [Xanthobacter agilis]